MKSKLFLKNKLKYEISLPSTAAKGERPASVKIAFYNGQYNYFPRKYTYGLSVRFNVEELEAITNKLKELNKGK